MEKVKRQEVLDILQYEKQRRDFHSYIIALKKKRRITLGPNISLVFENRDTIRHQIQEMMRVERIVDEDKIQKELDTYNELIPNDNELSSTMFIEIEDQSNIKEELDRFQGIDRPGRVYIALDGEKISASFEAGRSKEDKISAVQYLRFAFSPEQIEAFRRAKEVRVCVDHASYDEKVAMSPETRQALAEDFD